MPPPEFTLMPPEDEFTVAPEFIVKVVELMSEMVPVNDPLTVQAPPAEIEPEEVTVAAGPIVKLLPPYAVIELAVSVPPETVRLPWLMVMEPRFRLLVTTGL